MRELASRTGESITAAVRTSARERLARVASGKRGHLADDIARIAQRCAQLPIRDSRAADEIVGYDDAGSPT